MRIAIPTILLSLCFFSFLHCAEKTPKEFLFLYPKKATNLHIAITENNFPCMIHIVMEGNANPLAPDEYGVTPLDLARNPIVLAALLSSPKLETFIKEAASKGHTRILATLFSLQAFFHPQPNTPIEIYNRNRNNAYWQTGIASTKYTPPLNNFGRKLTSKDNS